MYAIRSYYELLAAPAALLQAMQELEQLQTRLTSLDLDMFTREIDRNNFV